MVIWALVFGMSLTLAQGTLTVGANVEAAFRTEVECKVVKEKLDKGSKEAVGRGEIPQNINSFGAVCVPINLDTHNKIKGTDS